MHVRTAWPGGSPSVRSRAYESAPITSESGTSAGRGPAPIAGDYHLTAVRRKWGRGSIRRRMRAQQITELSGPASALSLDEVPEPGTSHPMTGAEGVVVDVHAAGVSFPEVLQTRGEYQIKPPLPVRPGQRGRRASCAARPRARACEAGDRVAAFCMLGGFAEVAVAPGLPHVRSCPTSSTSRRAPG